MTLLTTLSHARDSLKRCVAREHAVRRALRSKMIEGVSNGWPKILSSLKSLLETGKPFSETTQWPKV